MKKFFTSLFLILGLLIKQSFNNPLNLEDNGDESRKSNNSSMEMTRAGKCNIIFTLPVYVMESCN